MEKKQIQITQFAQKVYNITKQIPQGKISTYKSIAIALGDANACRAVGTALRTNPFSPKVPCHRVIQSNGSLGGFFGKTNIQSEEMKKKIKMLLDEGIPINLNSNRIDKNKLADVLFTDFK
jgi:methylated-DNA-[protein]-cysteine S-methyltransferase